MSTSRVLTALVAGFMAMGLSRGPQAARALVPRPPAGHGSNGAPELPSLDPTGPAPRDVEVEITPDGRGAHRVVVRRRGFLVSLRNEDARSAGQDWTGHARLSPRGRRRGGWPADLGDHPRRRAS